MQETLTPELPNSILIHQPRLPVNIPTDQQNRRIGIDTPCPVEDADAEEMPPRDVLELVFRFDRELVYGIPDLSREAQQPTGFVVGVRSGTGTGDELVPLELPFDAFVFVPGPGSVPYGVRDGPPGWRSFSRVCILRKRTGVSA